MPNLLGLAGAQPQKPTRFAPIYNGRWNSGIWTNRSPLRDAATTRIVEKYYGAAGDALIAGSNTEITNRLTLARRPGNPVYDSNGYSAVDTFYSFRMFSQTQEQIDVMIDQASALYSLYNGTKSLVFTKSTGAGQSYMQSVGNSLYFGNGIDNKKWLQSLVTWSASMQWNTSAFPFFSTFLIDPNGNIQQLNATAIPVTNIQIADNILTVTSSETLTDLLSAGMLMAFPEVMNADFLENQTVSITAVSGDTFTAAFKNDDYDGAEDGVLATEQTGGTNPTSGGTVPTWSTVVPSAANNFQGGITQDGQVQWVNRGNPVKNWGIAIGSTPPVVTAGTSSVAWAANTFYSLVSVVVDSNGNLQQVTTPGKSNGTQPTWAATVGDTTSDGTVVWTMIQTAASLIWQPNTAYTQSVLLNLTSVADTTGGSTVYSGAITGGDSNAFAGKTFVISGWTHVVNNGVFSCTASTATTLTLSNAEGVSETNAAVAKLQGSFVIGNAAGVNCLFELAPQTQPSLTGNVSAYLYGASGTGAVGCVVLTNPTSLGSALANTLTENSLNFVGDNSGTVVPITWAVVNSAGETVGTNVPFPSFTQNYQLIILASLNVPIAGTYTFTIIHHDGLLWGMGNGAILVSGTSDNPLTGTGYPQTITPAEGFPVFGGTNRGLERDGLWTDTFTVTFPTAGTYPIEVDYAYWDHDVATMNVLCNGFNLANSSAGGGTPTSGANPPIWPAFVTTFAPNYPMVTESNGQLTWSNIGPVTDFAWAANTNFTLPDTTIIDPNGFEEAAYRTGISGAIAPTFATGANQLTFDNPNLIWINQGTAAIPRTGTLSTFNGGWQYCVALVDTLDSTVSNASPLSVATGNFVGVAGVQIAPGSGLPDPSVIDPQADYVAIFRTTDGEATPFLIPGQVTTWTVPLSEYLTSGYFDQTPDTGLDNLISAPINGENTPPAGGAINLTYHLNRLWYSIGNIVYWTAGPDTPAGNGINGTPPLNFDTFPSLVKRMVPTTSGLMVFTVSDVYLIQGSGTSSSPIQSGIPIMQGVGLQSYNALDINGSIIGFFTTDNQFCIIDPSAGVSYAGFPIGDQLRLDNGTPGTTWDASQVYVAWHVNGEDQAWYVSDGLFGWYRLMPTPAPESGYTWSPYASIVGGCKAVMSIEVEPGEHKLLLGPVGSGPILNRDLAVFQDNGVSYPANAVVGSAVLAQPGQIASVGFVTTDSIRVAGGTPLVLGLLLDEAVPYYTGPFDILKHSVNDPPTLRPSKSLMSQRFYLSDDEEPAVCRHMQMLVDFGTQSVQNELLTLTVFGGFFQEA